MLFRNPSSAASWLSRVAGLLLIVAVTLAGTFAGTFARAENWTDATGKFTIEGSFLALRGETVYLKKANGVTIAVPLAKLSLASQQQAKTLAAAAVPAANPDAPEAALRKLMEEVQSGNFTAAWNYLPTRYQSDVEDVIHTFAENMDPALWRSGSSIVKKSVEVLQKKKDFILNHPGLAAAPIDNNTISTNWDLVVDLLDTIAKSEITDLQKLKTLKVDAFLKGTGAEVSEKLVAITKVLDEQKVKLDDAFADANVAQFANAKISLVSVDGDNAVVKVENGDGESKEQALVRVDGKWLPKEMVDGWDEAIATMKTSLSTDMKAALQQNKQMVLLVVLQPINGVLDQLLAAQTQEEFNAVIDEVAQMVQGMAAGGAGGPPGLPPGIPPGAIPPGAIPPGKAPPSADPFGN